MSISNVIITSSMVIKILTQIVFFETKTMLTIISIITPNFVSFYIVFK